MRWTDALHPAWPRAALCEVCRRWARGTLCEECRARHGAPVPRCRGCGLRLPAGVPRCGACLRTPPPFDGCRCAVDYAFPWDGLVAAFKYHGRVELAGALAGPLCEALDAGWPDLVVPVPLAPARLAERGYNQAWELARRVAKRIGRPARAQVLARRVDHVHQAALSRRERQRNLQGAFTVPQPAAVAGRRVALVDDVLTTGATAAEASRALLGAGACAVQVWALARTP